MRRAPRCSSTLSIEDAVLAREFADAGRRLGFVERLDLHVQRALGAGHAAADAGAADAADDERPGAVGQLAGALDLGDGADGRELSVEPGDEDEAPGHGFGGGGGPLGLVALEGDRDHHAGQHDARGEREEREERSLGVCHSAPVTAGGYFRFPRSGFGMNSQLNVLFVTADQFRGDCLSAAGHPVVRTPNLDRLAASGVSFRRHFANAAPCGPSRAGLYTGMYLCNHRAAINGSPLDDRFTNVAREARALGYEPALFGYTDIGVDPRTVARRRPAPLQLRRRAARPGPGLPSPRGRPAASGWSGWPRRGYEIPDGLAGVRRPARAGNAVADAVPRRAHPDRVPHRTRPRLRRRPRRHAVVRAPLLSASTSAVSRARAVRHDVRPRGGARPRCARRRVRRKPRSIRCSA